MEFPDFVDYMKKIYAAYSKSPSAEQIDAFFEAIGHYDDADLNAARIEIVRTSKFFPKPADLAEIIRDRVSKRRRAKAQAERELQEVRNKEMERVACSPEVAKEHLREIINKLSASMKFN